MADERKTDRRTLQRVLELAEKQLETAKDDSQYAYWQGVTLGLRQALGEDIFTIQEIKTFTLIRTPVAAGSQNTTLEEVPNV